MFFMLIEKLFTWAFILFKIGLPILFIVFLIKGIKYLNEKNKEQ